MVPGKRPLTVVLLFLVALAVRVDAAEVVIGPGTGGANFRVPFHQNFNRTLSADTTYILTGWYFVDSTHSLTIPAGTLVRGDSASGGTLIVSRGAQIFATGTVQKPIVFTSNKPAGTRVPGDWGGVILLGAAPTNQPTTSQIEGGFGTIPNTAAQFGGSDSNDNSGVFEYVRIEFGGIAFAQDNEINGLTFGAIGAGTTIDHVQVSYANDDDYEFFGGTLQAKYMVGWRSLDDCFDTDFGFSGKMQFLFTKRDPNIFDGSASGSSNGEESDNEGTSPYTSTPRTKARFSNWTLVGPLGDTTNLAGLNSHWDHVAMLRRATELSIYNSIMMGWGNGIQLRDTLTQRAAIEGRLELRNISLQAPRNVLTLSSSPATGNITGFDPVVWFNTAGWGNHGSTPRQTTDVGLPAAVWNLNNAIDAVPLASSEAATAGAAFDGRLTGDSWFTVVSYRGAFDPSIPMSQQWTAGWTNFDPQNTDYTTDVKEIGGRLPERFVLEQNYPNPFNPSTVIDFSMPQSGHVTLKVYNTLGEEVTTLVEGNLAAGNYTTDFRATNLSSGTYFYTLTTDGFAQTKKMLLVK
jgi:Secretion system C-terminal sorting domain